LAARLAIDGLPRLLGLDGLLDDHQRNTRNSRAPRPPECARTASPVLPTPPLEVPAPPGRASLVTAAGPRRSPPRPASAHPRRSRTGGRGSWTCRAIAFSWG